MTIRTGPRRGAPTARVPFATDHAAATTAGTPYQVAGFNFPINFLPAGPIHGNLVGRQGLAIVPGSSNKLRTVERAWRRPGPNDGRVLRFRFEFAEDPENIDEGFGFLIDGFWLPTSGPSLLLSAWLSVDPGAGRPCSIDVTASSRLLATRPFSLMFATPPGVTWSSFRVLANLGKAPRRLMVDYFVELTQPSVRLPPVPRMARRYRRVGPRRRWATTRIRRSAALHRG